MFANEQKQLMSKARAFGFAVMLGLIAGPTNVPAQTPTQGTLEVCKISDPANPVTGSFTFSIVQGTTTLTRSVPVGACSGPITLAAGEASITEAAVTGVGVNSITATGLTAPTNRLVRSDLGARSAAVTIPPRDAASHAITRRNSG